MNIDEVKGKLSEMTGKLREKWGEPTDDEPQQAKGDRDQIVGLIQQKYGKTREAAEKEVDDFLKSIS